MRYAGISFLVLWLGVVVVVATTWADSGPTARAVRGAPPVRPNVILILTDDQRWDSLQEMPIIRDRLMPQSIVFNNAFATTPLCCPSRASILTGLYAFRHGVLTNGGPLGGAGNFNDARTLATELKRQTNYATGYIGKYLNGYFSLSPYIPPGWDSWQAVSIYRTAEYKMYFDYSINEDGVIVDYGLAESDYSTDVFVQRAVDFITAPRETPYFLHLGLYGPHNPQVPAPRHAGLYADYDPPRPPNFNEEDISDKPAWLAELGPLDIERVDGIQRDTLETLQSVDDAVGTILDTLESTGQISNTVVILTSDNGFAMGEHRIVGKLCPYDECLRVPLVIRHPTVAPTVVNRLVLNIDLPATIATIAGIQNGYGFIDGVSLSKLLTPGFTWRSDFLIENWNNPGGDLGALIPDYKGVRTAQWKYVEYGTGEMELYDLVNDPYELENVVDDPDNAATLAALQARLDELRPFDPPVTPSMVPIDPTIDYDE